MNKASKRRILFAARMATMVGAACFAVSGISETLGQEKEKSRPVYIATEGVAVSPVANGRYDAVEPDEECYEALKLIQVDHWNESQDALYFESKSDSKWHSENLEFLFKYGKHYFYK